MNGHVGSAHWRNRILLLGLVSLGSCAQEGLEPGVSHGELTAAGGGSSCVPLDPHADSMPDGVDEDCDGSIDEDVEATPADCPRGTRVIEGTSGNDTLHGTPGRDCILGYGGNDIIRGYGGDDVIFGGPGNDRIYTGRGNSLVRAGSGDDFVDTSFSFVSVVYGEAGNDHLVGGWGFDTLYGGDGNDRISGGGGPDFLSGGGCHDYLVGAGSFDVSHGGDGFDVCDTELSRECERGRRSGRLCDEERACPSGQRCAAGSGICVPEDAEACGEANSCVPTADIDSTCDGIDDDCDGVIDDDFVAQETSCGVGGCGSTGETSCVAGQVVDSCSPSSPEPNTDSVCNGLDDDCDGAIDEGFVVTATSCGIGLCAATGQRICSEGQVVDTCRSGSPNATDDVCNGVDDDCDGAVDEEFTPTETTCGLGVCESTGVTSCVDGTLLNSCEPAPPLSDTDETCDLVDDNCDGLLDEGFPGVPTTCGYGECATTGSTACVEGYVIDTCVVECEGHCADGLEDDGDGLVDCADPDCAENPAWPQCQMGRIGSGCASDADCVEPGSRCDTGFPGGYCYRDCADGCPEGSFCWAGVACVQACVGPGEQACPRPEQECRVLESAGVMTPFCRPTCEVSCPSGTTCSEDWRCI